MSDSRYRKEDDFYRGTSSVDEIICPYCGYVDDDLWELDVDKEFSDLYCGDCDELFEVRLAIMEPYHSGGCTRTFVSRKKKGNAAQAHNEEED